jgi:hypothetical protein
MSIAPEISIQINTKLVREIRSVEIPVDVLRFYLFSHIFLLFFVIILNLNSFF